uniref:Uncharacterized protein n=1 Tax=Anguilla anguilla TaxID=7936 RepID=A0A0E9SHB9_ANGAN
MSFMLEIFLRQCFFHRLHPFCARASATSTGSIAVCGKCRFKIISLRTICGWCQCIFFPLSLARHFFLAGTHLTRPFCFFTFAWH